MRYELFHSAFEEQPVGVAIMDSDLPVEEALEKLWTATQNVEENWVTAQGQFGIKVEPSADVIARGGARSSSTGDFVALYLDQGLTIYRCMPAGWVVEPKPSNFHTAVDKANVMKAAQLFPLMALTLDDDEPSR
jgi:hypothetical protein